MQEGLQENNYGDMISGIGSNIIELPMIKRQEGRREKRSAVPKHRMIRSLKAVQQRAVLRPET